MTTSEKVLSAYPDDLLAALILDLSDRRWRTEFEAERLEAAKEEQQRRRRMAGGSPSLQTETTDQ